MEIASSVRPLQLAVTRLALAPWSWLTSPRFLGLENLPEGRPVLLAGNHTVMGLLDVPLLVLGLNDRTGRNIRSLGDHAHFKIPGWRAVLESCGVVDGTRDNCRALMAAGETLLVFPGGAREVFKRKGERYQLFWKERVGFVRLAIEHGYPIVPFAAVGAEECLDIVLDSDEILETPLLGPALRRLVPRADWLPPIVRGIGPTPLPRPERFYFSLARPVETSHLVGRESDDALCLRVRDEVRAAVEQHIAFLMVKRQDESRWL